MSKTHIDQNSTTKSTLDLEKVQNTLSNLLLAENAALLTEFSSFVGRLDEVNKRYRALDTSNEIGRAAASAWDELVDAIADALDIKGAGDSSDGDPSSVADYLRSAGYVSQSLGFHKEPVQLPHGKGEYFLVPADADAATNFVDHKDDGEKQVTDSDTNVAKFSGDDNKSAEDMDGEE